MKAYALLVCGLAACSSGPEPSTGHDGGVEASTDGSLPDVVVVDSSIDSSPDVGPIDPNDPAQRSAADVCARWKADHVLTDQKPFTAGAGGACDLGTLSAAGKADALTRLNGFRWLVGLGPTTEDASLDTGDQQCANLESWWDFSSPDSPHAPPPTAKCYTSGGAAAAGASSIAWGNGPADSIDQLMEDVGNAATLGHRRWFMNPPLGPVGIGYWEGGGTFNSAECVAVLGSSGTGPVPSWVAVPNQGFVPMPIPSWTWSFHSADSGTSTATIKVVRASDSANLAVTRTTLTPGYGQDAISWTPKGWAAAPNETYQVTISGLTTGDVTYAVKPITCN